MAAILIKFDGTVYRTEIPFNLESPTDDRIPVTGIEGRMGDDWSYICRYGGTVEIIARDFMAMGSWQIDHISDAMEQFFHDYVDDGIFDDGEDGPTGRLLAEATADGHELYTRDGDLPEWLMERANEIVTAWRKDHA